MDVVFERGWPGRDRGLTEVDLVFVEVEDGSGRSIRVGEWLTREDGHVVLRLPDPPQPPAPLPAVTVKVLEPAPPVEAFHDSWKRACPYCGSFQLGFDLPLPSYVHHCLVDGQLTQVVWP